MNGAPTMQGGGRRMMSDYISQSLPRTATVPRAAVMLLHLMMSVLLLCDRPFVSAVSLSLFIHILRNLYEGIFRRVARQENDP